MRIPTVEKCCCGCNLRLGSAIIGIIFFLSNLATLISYSVKADEENGDSRATYIIGAILAAFMMASTGLLLLGVHKERYGWLKPWLFLFATLACIFVGLCVIGSIVAFATVSVGTGFAFLIVGLIYFVVYAYCLCVVYSYYLSLQGVQPGTV